MKGDRIEGGIPLSYFHRDLDAVRKLSGCIRSIRPETVVYEALDVAEYFKTRIMMIKPELKSFLQAMEDIVKERLSAREDRFRYDELLQISLLAKTFSEITIRRYLCAYKMMLTVAHSERFFIDGILIFYSARLESKAKKGRKLEEDEEVMSELEYAIENIISNLMETERKIESSGTTSPAYLSSPDRETERSYTERMERKLQVLLEEKGHSIRQGILKKRNNSGDMKIPEFEPTVSFGYRFRRALYSNHATVVKEPSRIIKSHPELTKKGYALFLAFQIMEDFRKDEDIHPAMQKAIGILKEHLEGTTTKREVSKHLIRLVNIADGKMDDAVSYQVETFINAVEALLGQEISSRAIRTDLSASLESNYHIQSPRKTKEILEYHLDSLEYMDEVMRNYDDILPVLDSMENGSKLIAETEPPYRPDLTEKDMEHLASGAENVRRQYEVYRKNSRYPRPLDSELGKDSIDELLSRRDDIRYEIYSIVPDEEDIRLFRSMNFRIRDIF